MLIMIATAPKIQVNPIIRQRWSPRAFQTEGLSDEMIATLLEAGRLAPSSFNLQPWRFIYAKQENKEAYNRLFNVLMEPNQTWAGSAPFLILAMAQVTNPVTGEQNPHAWHDVGLAMENMVLQAEYLGLKAHQMGGFYADKAKADFAIPEDFQPVSVTAFGYPGDPEQLPEKLKASEEQWDGREPLSHLFFEGGFDQPTDL